MVTLDELVNGNSDDHISIKDKIIFNEAIFDYIVKYFKKTDEIKLIKNNLEKTIEEYNSVSDLKERYFDYFKDISEYTDYLIDLVIYNYNFSNEKFKSDYYKKVYIKKSSFKNTLLYVHNLSIDSIKDKYKIEKFEKEKGLKNNFFDKVKQKIFFIKDVLKDLSVLLDGNFYRNTCGSNFYAPNEKVIYISPENLNIIKKGYDYSRVFSHEFTHHLQEILFERKNLFNLSEVFKEGEAISNEYKVTKFLSDKYEDKLFLKYYYERKISELGMLYMYLSGSCFKKYYLMQFDMFRDNHSKIFRESSIYLTHSLGHYIFIKNEYDLDKTKDYYSNLIKVNKSKNL